MRRRDKKSKSYPKSLNQRNGLTIQNQQKPKLLNKTVNNLFVVNMDYLVNLSTLNKRRSILNS